METPDSSSFQIPEVIVYDLQSEPDHHRFAEAITQLPQSTCIRPWQATHLSGIVAEAAAAGIYADKMPKYAQEARHLGPLPETEALRPVVVEYPWRMYRRFLLVPERDMFYAINYSRNACIFSEAEQHMAKRVKVGIAGLSVGGVAGILLVKSGFLNIVGIDGGLVDGKDLNRSGFGTTSAVGLPQAYAFKTACLEINPFANINAYYAYLGDTGYRVADFVRESDIVIDEVDALDIKWDIRIEAKKQRKVVVMGTDLGSGALLQIEHPDTPPFFGKIHEDSIHAYKADPGNHALKTQTVVAMIGGAANIPPHYIQALAEAQQRKLGYWPQIGEAAYLTAALVSKAIRKSLTGAVASCEILIDLEDVIKNNTPFDFIG
jgi:hypothetical protein